MYRIIGTDGREYGPATAGQLRQWITEGRANAHTQTLAPGALEWRPLGALPEFAAEFTLPPPPVIGPRPGISWAVPQRKTNGFAAAGLIFGILSLTCCCCCGCPFSILGLICSLIGWSQISRQPELYEGRGLAVAGLILSAAGLLLGTGLSLLHFALHPGHFDWRFKTF